MTQKKCDFLEEQKSQEREVSPFLSFLLKPPVGPLCAFLGNKRVTAWPFTAHFIQACHSTLQGPQPSLTPFQSEGTLPHGTEQTGVEGPPVSKSLSYCR